MYDEILQALIDFACPTADVGSMPPDNGIAMQAYGGIDKIHNDVGGTGRITLVVNGKNTNQHTVIDQLNAIHQLLTKRKDFPSGSGWQIYSIHTASSPRLIGREANSQWLYGSALTVNFYERGL